MSNRAFMNHDLICRAYVSTAAGTPITPVAGQNERLLCLVFNQVQALVSVTTAIHGNS
ncbi:hypothetical protein PGT21_026801 [Puccinia graminis f. sp. tritici]|uniref:Uncharacterized protein n=1 Tax=Puccinia graminis f. sp. tritici TaxID=56615 RepID=A0A5B0PYN9_PUCGR|nr:hypothetical protein PGT21_026801 [Puccinia graminis f. sp. tritici]KAA1120904.1 hypothetical protein PGTUg99_014163 [Puccinia graminis f. sp. tritici]